MPSAGRLDRRITIQRDQGTAVDEAGQHVPEFRLYHSCSAEVEPLSGREALQAQTLTAKIDTRFRVRYDTKTAAVTASETFRIVYAGRIYDITKAAEDPRYGRRRVIEILAWARAEVAAA